MIISGSENFSASQEDSQVEVITVFRGGETTIDVDDKLNHPKWNFTREQKVPSPKIFTTYNKNIVFSGNLDEEVDSLGGPISLGRVLNLFTPGAAIYTHWLFDLLPKLDCLQFAGVDLSRYDKIIVNGVSSPFQKASFQALSIPVDKVVTLKSLDGRRYHCDELTTVGPVRQAYFTGLWVIDFIRRVFPVKKPEGQFSKRVYLSRGKASRRRVINESQVVDLLDRLNVQTIYCEDYSINEMHWIMNNSELVVAPHGAGLCNIAFCNPGVKVVEFFSQHISPEYYLFSKILNLSYRSVPCPDSDGRIYSELFLDYENDFIGVNSANIFADLEQLEKSILY
ncbi:glycosyltransferase family 61 protein [Microbulbifer sp. JTAC008]|uniref:glycosyltransferase family 61 protein n=1 Tax=unclassified Microbulbifer TaxID=2619833 RepID=UPI00403995B1